MGLTDFFKKVSTLTPDEVRTYLDENEPGMFNLVDVRQPAEYESDHIPGARLIPLGELESRAEELDPGKMTFVY